LRAGAGRRIVRAVDLRSFKIHGPDRHVRLVIGDHRGEQALDLEGAAFERVFAAAESVLDDLEERAGAPVRALSVDGVGRVLRLTTDEARPRPHVLMGAAYAAIAAELAPLARAILAEVRVRGEDLAGATPSDAAFWEHLYRDEEASWELGRAAPPLAMYFAGHRPEGARVLVVGCGRGHEARMLAERGASVVAIDISTRAIAAARAATPDGASVEFRVHDLFVPLAERFDLVVEHTCFCAIDPERRDEYVDRTADALVPGGRLVGLFYVHEKPGGPPHTTDEKELRARFGRRFVIESLEDAEGSALAREGQELLGEFVRRSTST
jgi:SAM-dependent methyltransferase